MNANPLKKWATALAAAATITTAASAAFIAPNTPFTPGVPLAPGTSFASDPTLAGTVAGDQTVSFTDISPVPAFSGTLRSVVVRNTAGLLDFYVQLANTSPFQVNVDQEIFRLTLSGFNGVGTGPGDLLNVNFRTDGLAGITGAGVVNNGTVAPTTGDRDPGIPFRGVGFNFGSFLDDPANNVDPGETSRFLLIRTNATAFNSVSNIGIVSGAGTAFARSFAPAIPEPGNLLGGLGLIPLLGYLELGRFRRRSPVASQA